MPETPLARQAPASRTRPVRSGASRDGHIHESPSGHTCWMLATMLSTDAALRVVLDYRTGHGTLPFGPAAAFWV